MHCAVHVQTHTHYSIEALYPLGKAVHNQHVQYPMSGTETSESMMTSSNGNIFRVTGPLCGEFTGPGEFPTQRPVTRSFDVFFDLRLNKRLSIQPWGWWFETLSWSLWRHRNAWKSKYPYNFYTEVRIVTVTLHSFVHITHAITLGCLGDKWLFTIIGKNARWKMVDNKKTHGKQKN